MIRLISVLFFLISFATFSQRVKPLEGDIKTLSGITQYNVVFDYSTLLVTQFETEEDFLKEKIDRREEKQIGSGEKFKEKWFADRENHYEPYFIDNFNAYFVMKRKILISKNNTEAKYTIKIITNEIYPGYFVGVFEQKSKLRTTIEIYKTNSPENILFKSKQLYTSANDFNSAFRIAKSYALAGRKLADYLRRKTL